MPRKTPIKIGNKSKAQIEKGNAVIKLLDSQIEDVNNIIMNRATAIVKYLDEKRFGSWDFFDELGADIGDVVDEILRVVEQKMQWAMLEIVNPVLETFKGFGIAIRNGFKTVADWLNRTLQGFMTTITNVTTGLFGEVMSFTTTVKDKFIGLANWVWNGLDTLWGKAKDGFSSVVSGIAKLADGIINGLGTVLTLFANLLVQLLEGMLTVSEDVMAQTLASMARATQKAGDILIETLPLEEKALPRGD